MISSLPQHLSASSEFDTILRLCYRMCLVTLATIILSSSDSIIAGLAFLIFSALGMAIQLWKIWRRVVEQRASGSWVRGYATSGLLPFREFMAFLMFFIFFSSGLTRNQIDLMLVSTRFPAVLISVAIVTALFLDQRTTASKVMFSVTALLTVFGSLLFYGRLIGSVNNVEFMANWVDRSLLVLLIPFLIGRVRNAYVIWNLPERSVASAFREIGNGLKDLTGMYYAFGRIEDLFFVFVSHSVSVLTSALLLAAILRNRENNREHSIAGRSRV